MPRPQKSPACRPGEPESAESRNGPGCRSNSSSRFRHTGTRNRETRFPSPFPGQIGNQGEWEWGISGSGPYAAPRSRRFARLVPVLGQIAIFKFVHLVHQIHPYYGRLWDHARSRRVIPRKCSRLEPLHLIEIRSLQAVACILPHAHPHSRTCPSSDARLTGPLAAWAVTAGACGTNTAAGRCSFACALHEEVELVRRAGSTY
jgi:hypothetical protein